MTRKTAKARKGFPLYITGEPMNLTIYRERCRGEVRYALTYYDSSGGRQRRTLGTVDEASAEATKLQEEIRQGGWDLITLLYLEDLDLRLGRFAEAFKGPISEVALPMRVKAPIDRRRMSVG